MLFKKRSAQASIKKDKMSKNKFNKRSTQFVHWKLHNITERNKRTSLLTDQDQILLRKYGHTLFYCASLLYFADTFFLNKICVIPTSSKSINVIFPMIFAHFISVSHFGNSPNISNFFIIISAMANRRGKSRSSNIFSWVPKSLQTMVTVAMKFKRCLLLGRKAMTNSVLKSKDISLPTKARTVKAMVLPAVIYGCESWTIKKVEHQRIDAFELWCWRRLLRVLWTALRPNKSIQKEINPEYPLEGLMLKLQTLGTWCKEPTHWKRPWCWEKLRRRRRRRRRGGRGWDGWMALLTQWTWVWANSGRCDGQRSQACCSPWGRKELHMT